MYDHHKQLYGIDKDDGTIEWDEVEPAPDKTVSIELYHTDVGVFFSPEGADFYMHTVHGCNDSEFQDAFDKTTLAMAFASGKDGSVDHIGVIFPTPPDGGLLAHECLHLVDYICDEIGIELTMDTMEPRAYMLQYLFDNISEAIGEWQEEYPTWPN